MSFLAISARYAPDTKDAAATTAQYQLDKIHNQLTRGELFWGYLWGATCRNLSDILHEAQIHGSNNPSAEATCCASNGDTLTGWSTSRTVKTPYVHIKVWGPFVSAADAAAAAKHETLRRNNTPTTPRAAVRLAKALRVRAKDNPLANKACLALVHNPHDSALRDHVAFMISLTDPKPPSLRPQEEPRASLVQRYANIRHRINAVASLAACRIVGRFPTTDLSSPEELEHHGMGTSLLHHAIHDPALDLKPGVREALRIWTGKGRKGDLQTFLTDCPTIEGVRYDYELDEICTQYRAHAQEIDTKRHERKALARWQERNRPRTPSHWLRISYGLCHERDRARATMANAFRVPRTTAAAPGFPLRPYLQRDGRVFGPGAFSGLAWATLRTHAEQWHTATMDAYRNGTRAQRALVSRRTYLPQSLWATHPVAALWADGRFREDRRYPNTNRERRYGEAPEASTGSQRDTRGYHSVHRSRAVRTGAGDITPTRMGTELEICADAEEIDAHGWPMPRGWRAEYDSSLRPQSGETAAEVITPPLQSAQWAQKIQRYVASLPSPKAGARRVCGMHTTSAMAHPEHIRSWMTALHAAGKYCTLTGRREGSSLNYAQPTERSRGAVSIRCNGSPYALVELRAFTMSTDPKHLASKLASIRLIFHASNMSDEATNNVVWHEVDVDGLPKNLAEALEQEGNNVQAWVAAWKARVHDMTQEWWETGPAIAIDWDSVPTHGTPAASPTTDHETPTIEAPEGFAIPANI